MPPGSLMWLPTLGHQKGCNAMVTLFKATLPFCATHFSVKWGHRTSAMLTLAGRRLEEWAADVFICLEGSRQCLEGIPRIGWESDASCLQKKKKTKNKQNLKFIMWSILEAIVLRDISEVSPAASTCLPDWTWSYIIMFFIQWDR